MTTWGFFTTVPVLSSARRRRSRAGLDRWCDTTVTARREILEVESVEESTFGETDVGHQDTSSRAPRRPGVAEVLTGHESGHLDVAAEVTVLHREDLDVVEVVGRRAGSRRIGAAYSPVTTSDVVTASRRHARPPRGARYPNAGAPSTDWKNPVPSLSMGVPSTKLSTNAATSPMPFSAWSRVSNFVAGGGVEPATR